MRKTYHTYGLPLNALYALSGDKASAFSDKSILKMGRYVNETRPNCNKKHLFDKTVEKGE